MGRGLLAASLSALLVVLIVFVLAVLVVSVVIIVVVADNSSWAQGRYGKVRARRSVSIVQDKFAATEDGLGALLAVEKQLAAWYKEVSEKKNLPYAVCLSVQHVESADILPRWLIKTNDIGQILDYWTAEVESKVGAIVVATSRPRLVPGIFTRFLGVVGQDDVYGVEVEEGAGRRRADGTGCVVLLLRLGVVGSSGAECDGQTKCQQMAQDG